MEWQNRLWHELIPHLPVGRVGLWASPPCRPHTFAVPPQTLPEWHDPASPIPPAGAALQGLVLLGNHTPTPLPWPDFLCALHPLLAPQAPLLLLVPRQGLITLRENDWRSPLDPRQWQRALQSAGWQVNHHMFLGGACWPGAWATAALRLYICQRQGVALPQRLQFISKRGGTAPATGCGA